VEKLKSGSDGGDSGSKKCKRGYGGAFCGVWRSLESGGRFCVGAFGRNLAAVAVKMFPRLIYFKRNAINFVHSMRFTDNAGINCVTVQHKKGSFPSTLMGHTTTLVIIKY
jgi:hypothetical protein